MKHIANILFDLGSNEFLTPYLRCLLTPDYDPERPTDEPAPTAGVRIFHRDRNRPGDEEFTQMCSRLGLPVVTLVCPNIMGTGMNGMMRRLAEGIYKGSYFHITGAEGRTAVVHATDVARAAAMAAGSSGEYVLTDGVERNVYDVAEALAYRIDNKRLFSMPQWLARWWYSKDFYHFLTADTTEVNTFLAAFPEFSPADTLNYLHTHIYDDASL